MSETDALVANARAYERGFEGGGMGPAPARRVAVLACMDARLDPCALLGLEPGDAHVIRNAGGVASDDAIRSLAISQHLLGTEEVVLVHHTDCGMLGLTDQELAERLEAASGERPPWPVHGFADVEQDVLDGIALIRQSPFIPRTESVRGFVFSVETGELREVGDVAAG